MALTALKQWSGRRWPLDSPCRLEALLCHDDFVERLTAGALFFASCFFPAFHNGSPRVVDDPTFGALPQRVERQKPLTRQIFGRILRQNLTVR
jgi:hypothetical protein